VALTVALAPVVPRALFVFAFGAVVVAARYGGVGPGLAAALLCVLGVDYYLIPPARALQPADPTDVIPLGVFVLVAGLVGTLTASLRAARDAAAAHAAQADDAAARLEEQAVELELTNQQLQDQAAELEMANQQLQEQAVELEHQTDALQATAAAVEAERARLDRVITQLPAAVAVFEGPELRFRAVSAAYRRIVGGRDVVGRPIREALPELSGGPGGADFFALLDGVRRTGEPVVGTAVPAAWDDNGDGVPEDHLVDLVYAPLHGPGVGAGSRAGEGVGDAIDDGTAEGVVALVLDVSARGRAEAAVRESEARFRHMADAAPVMLWVTEADGRCTFLNRAWLEFTGQTLEQGLGLGWLDAVHPDDAADAERAFLDATARAGPFHVEYRLRRRDGAYRRAVDAAAPRLGPGGEFLGYVGSVVDVEERAGLLDAERAARAGAEEANRAKSEFLATMSHELRTPLNAIGGYAELLDMGLHGPVTDAQRGALARVQAAQRHLLGLINDVLNYAKLEGGRVEYDVRVVDLADVVRDVAPLVEPQLAAKGLRFDVRLPDAPCVVWADREKLGQVLVNLLSNATKFTDPGGRVTVSVAADTTARDGLACLHVTDTGRGIPATSTRPSSSRSCSCGRATRGRPRGRGWGWRSAGTWRAAWAATCGCGASRARGRRSPWRCGGP
jgi:PAS domain S-box-containing protein